jgi:hypothetical protein
LEAMQLARPPSCANSAIAELAQSELALLGSQRVGVKTLLISSAPLPELFSAASCLLAITTPNEWRGDLACGCVAGLLHGHSMCNSRIVL